MVIDDMLYLLGRALEFLLWPLKILTYTLIKLPATLIWFLAGTYLAYLSYPPITWELRLVICITAWIISGLLFGFWVGRDQEDNTILTILSVLCSGFVLYLPFSWLLQLIVPS